MEKTNKKQLKQMEEAKKAQRRLRRDMMESLQNYWRDVAAMERVAKITGNNDILLGGELIEEERNKLFANYTVLQGLTDNQLLILRTLINNEEERQEYLRGSCYAKFKEDLPDGSILMKDFVWKEEELLEQIDLLKRIGITKIYFVNASTAVLREMVWLYRAGGKIVGTTNIDEYNEGLVIEI